MLLHNIRVPAPMHGSLSFVGSIQDLTVDDNSKWRIQPLLDEAPAWPACLDSGILSIGVVKPRDSFLCVR